MQEGLLGNEGNPPRSSSSSCRRKQSTCLQGWRQHSCTSARRLPAASEDSRAYALRGAFLTAPAACRRAARHGDFAPPQNSGGLHHVLRLWFQDSTLKTYRRAGAARALGPVPASALMVSAPSPVPLLLGKELRRQLCFTDENDSGALCCRSPPCCPEGGTGLRTAGIRSSPAPPGGRNAAGAPSATRAAPGPPAALRPRISGEHRWNSRSFPYKKASLCARKQQSPSPRLTAEVGSCCHRC